MQKTGHGVGRHRGRLRAVGLPLTLLLLMIGLALTGSALKGYVLALDVDIAQERLDTATPPLDGSHILVQSFVCQHPNLCELELLPAVYQTPGQGMLTLQLRSPSARHSELAQWSVDAAHIGHNAPLHFTFAPQPDSAGKAYELWLEGTPGARVGFWYNSVNAYGGGELELDHAETAGDLRFITRFRYDLSMMASGMGRGLMHGGWLVALATVLLLLPGYALRQVLSLAEDKDPIASLALTLATSLALVPTALLWTTVLGLHWQRSLCWLAVAGLALYALARLLRTMRSSSTLRRVPGSRWSVLGTLGLLVFTLLVRFVQTRDLALPAWVDSPQHALVTQLVATSGQVPRSYEPLLPVQNFSYHFGFHADATLFHWLSGLAIPQAILVLGQLLNAASALMAYLLTWRLTGRRLASVMAMLIVALVSYMPAYYASWGRYTQLTGLVLLPAALVSGLDWLEARRRDYRRLGVAALLQAGLLLTHARVTVYGACFWIGYCLYETLVRLRHRNGGESRELWVRATLLSGLALGLSGPWLVRVLAGISASLRASGQTLAGEPSYNALAQGFLFIPRNRELIALAAVGAVWGLLRRRKETVWILAWIGAVAAILNPGWLGLPTTNLVNNATAVISLFLPLSVLGGQTLVFAWDRAQPALTALFRSLGRSAATVAAQAVLAALLAGLALWGARGMVSIVNPVTILATAEDVEAIHWVTENTRPDAVFLINARQWQLGMYTGTDGGYWLPQLAGRRTLLPPLPYAHGTPDYVRHIGEVARIVSEAKDADDPQLQGVLEQEQVTHVYIGAKGGPLTPQMFLRSQRYRPVYSSGAVWIFEVVRQSEQGTARLASDALSVDRSGRANQVSVR